MALRIAWITTIAIILGMVAVRPIEVYIGLATPHTISFPDDTPIGEVAWEVAEVQNAGWILDFGYRLGTPSWNEIEEALRSPGVVWELAGNDYFVVIPRTNWDRLLLQLSATACVYFVIRRYWLLSLDQTRGEQGCHPLA